jgi:excisionase family DNA binding protein
MPIKREVLTVDEIVKAYKVSKSSVYSKIASGELPSVVLPGGRLRRVPIEAAEAMLTPVATEAKPGAEEVAA